MPIDSRGPPAALRIVGRWGVPQTHLPRFWGFSPTGARATSAPPDSDPSVTPVNPRSGWDSDTALEAASRESGEGIPVNRRSPYYSMGSPRALKYRAAHSLRIVGALTLKI
jgi:hypothetical protein